MSFTHINLGIGFKLVNVIRELEINCLPKTNKMWSCHVKNTKITEMGPNFVDSFHVHNYLSSKMLSLKTGEWLASFHIQFLINIKDLWLNHEEKITHKIRNNIKKSLTNKKICQQFQTWDFSSLKIKEKWLNIANLQYFTVQ